MRRLASANDARGCADAEVRTAGDGLLELEAIVVNKRSALFNNLLTIYITNICILKLGLKFKILSFA